MSIKNKPIADLKELQETLIACPHIQEVHFTSKGLHYFNKYELDDEDGNKRYFGYLNTSLEVYKIVGERKYFKLKSIENPKTEIVETLSRKQILALKVADEPISKKDQKLVDQLSAENESLKAELEALKSKSA